MLLFIFKFFYFASQLFVQFIYILAHNVVRFVSFFQLFAFGF